MDSRDGPLPLLLLVLTSATGLIDAVSYLGLGRVFVANMTGNLVFLGFAVTAAPGFSWSSSAWALAAFGAGAFVAGALGRRQALHRARLLATASGVQLLLVGLALLAAMAGTTGRIAGPLQLLLIVLLALAMGVQTATVRRLAVSDLTTTVLTQTLTGLAADAAPGAATGARQLRRVLSAATMLLGAAGGTLIVWHAGVPAALGLAWVLMGVSALAAARHWSSSAAWTAPGVH